MQFSMQSIISQAVESIRAHFNFFIGITLLFFMLNGLIELIVVGVPIKNTVPLLFFSTISMALYVKQAVVVHRSVILNEADRWDKVFSWGLPESSFFVLSLGLWLLFGLFIAVLGLVLAPFLVASSMSEGSDTFFWMVSSFAILIGGLVFSKVCLMFPARAVGKSLSVNESANKTKSVFFKVMALVVFLPLITNLLMNQLLSEDTLIYNLFINLIAHLLVVFQVSILSHTYLALVGAPETNEPETLGV